MDRSIFLPRGGVLNEEEEEEEEEEKEEWEERLGSLSLSHNSS